MPAPKKAVAETVTPVDVGADIGNELTALETMQAVVLQQQAMIERLGEQVEQMSKTAQSDEPPALADPADFGPPALPEGHRRYGARFSELTLIRQAGKHIHINGTAIWEPQVAVDFSGGVFQTDDEDTMVWLENHPDYNVTFWQDDYAIKRHSMIEVTQGVRTSVSTPRAPLAAPMKP